MTSPLLLSALLPASDASEKAASPDSYDVAVKAKAIDLVPSIMPRCDDCIIMHWPWFLDLKVAKVLDRRLDGKIIPVLSMQHTYLRSRYRVWWLRRNADVGFNVVHAGANGEQPARCLLPAQPVQPNIRSTTKTLGELRREGIEEYGHYPKQ